ncbi:Peroxisomal acyl-coenzyme A oxidase 1 [Bienertia sinuspersici]
MKGKKRKFDVEAMKIFWAGSQHKFQVADRMARLVASDPVFKKDDRVRLERKELFKGTLRKAAHAWKRIVELRLSGNFIPAIKGQGTEEQQRQMAPVGL